ncbi:hypothetical protein RvY_11188 [Ramazzottius varieornatus]|uniref:Reverse transcriptase domain-containing protein n=1 Tax=Ramazzottius varieornatus TaxID=947166 RepID=A0A1D1VHC9_RAMVA|nr:hypothetical protein RvY_11188 [Ramazzottius varieornatus]
MVVSGRSPSGTLFAVFLPRSSARESTNRWRSELHLSKWVVEQEAERKRLFTLLVVSLRMKMTVVVFMFKIDFKNAFNTIHRDKLLDLVREVLPNYHSFVWQCYRFPSRLIYGQHILASARGVQQGDPLGPMPFCLAIEVLTNKLTSPLNLGYLDDGTIGGDCSKVLADFCTLISEGIRIGLQLNPSKTELSLQGGTAGERESIRRAFSLVCPGIISPFRAELTLLGAPLLQEASEPAIEEK